MLSHGTFALDADSGAVLDAEVSADGPPGGYSLTIAVRYREDPQLTLLVPLDMQERSWQPHKPRDHRLDVASSYSNFRRLQVKVDEQIKLPK